jgi:class 3 adenylate cyclase
MAVLPRVTGPKSNIFFGKIVEQAAPDYAVMFRKQTSTDFLTDCLSQIHARETVPEPKDIRLGSNHALELEHAIVLYADIDGSTTMVDKLAWQRSAKLYKTYLYCASRILTSEGGTITAYDGDRVMAIWPKQNRTRAVRAAMKINYAVIHLIRPAYAAQYSSSNFELKHVIGIDLGTLRAARTGIRGDNDIVWVGSAANHAAKLCSLSTHPLWITKAVYDGMQDETKYGGNPKRDMWEKRRWTQMNDKEVYCSNWWWSIP